MMGLRKCRAPNGRAIRWLRIAAIAVSSIILASCRAVTVPPIPSLAVLFESSSVDAPLSDHTVAQLDPEVQPSGHVHPSEEIQASIPDQQSRQPDGRQIQQAGLEVPCPPLPRHRSFKGVAAGPDASLPGYGQPFSASLTAQQSSTDAMPTQKQVAAKGYRTIFDSARNASYAYDPASQTFITFDNEAAVAAKADFIRREGLAGAMVWALGQETPSLWTALTNGL